MSLNLPPERQFSKRVNDYEVYYIFYTLLSFLIFCVSTFSSSDKNEITEYIQNQKCKENKNKNVNLSQFSCVGIWAVGSHGCLAWNN